jgi:D-aminopeptidase
MYVFGVTKTLQLARGIVASAAIAWASGNTARAGEPAPTVAHKVVSIRDLDLNSAEGLHWDSCSDAATLLHCARDV